jgi:RimJ/RimL family protein N-acetyltransferase
MVAGTAAPAIHRLVAVRRDTGSSRCAAHHPLAAVRQTARMPGIVAPRLSDGEIGVRPIAESDIPDIVAACSDPQIPRWTRVPSPYTREDAERFVAIAATEAAAGEGVALAVCDADDRLIGTIGLMELDRRHRRGEIGYWTAAAARGRGAATRAVALVREWARAELGLAELQILAHRDNRPSQLVAERAGFEDTGEIRSVPRMPQRIRDGYKVYVWRAR